jgi:hypothetical protein
MICHHVLEILTWMGRKKKGTGISRNPQPETQTPNPQPETLNPNPKPITPKPLTLKP